ncbi:MAG: NAD(P)(+) transhydrogenase (Re/Si-specific) subunit alpha, partial [Coxiellaceae bacterium]|nr:NAD(P)(+) transhydrogenase (Re/Si-specific) subunit alpha [Coxiellaceae bacterium]
PMLMTAAGTITPAKVLILGVGVMGLQAIATARRLGAVVDAYDVRPVVKEQVQSLGANFIELAIDTEDSETQGGYAKAQSDAFYQRQRELLTKVVAGADVVITTALVPGRKAPILLTKEMVAAMKSGAIVLDGAAEKGGNCELTKMDQEVMTEHGVLVLGPGNLPSLVAYHASQMYSTNMTHYLNHLIQDDGKLSLDGQDEIVTGTLVAQGGKIVNAMVLNALNKEPA